MWQGWSLPEEKSVGATGEGAASIAVETRHVGDVKITEDSQPEPVACEKSCRDIWWQSYRGQGTQDHGSPEDHE